MSAQYALACVDNAPHIFAVLRVLDDDKVAQLKIPDHLLSLIKPNACSIILSRKRSTVRRGSSRFCARLADRKST